MKNSYQELSEQLEEVLAKLQQPDIQVDEALRLYEQGLKLARQCDAQLKLSENKIVKLKMQFESEGQSG